MDTLVTSAPFELVPVRPPVCQARNAGQKQSGGALHSPDSSNPLRVVVPLWQLNPPLSETFDLKLFPNALDRGYQSVQVLSGRVGAGGEHDPEKVGEVVLRLEPDHGEALALHLRLDGLGHS